MPELTAEAVAAALTAAGEHPAARHESGWAVALGVDSVLVNYRAAGAGEAVMKREALARWMRVLGTSGHDWTVEGRGSRKLARLHVSAPGRADAAARGGQE